MPEKDTRPLSRNAALALAWQVQNHVGPGKYIHNPALMIELIDNLRGVSAADVNDPDMITVQDALDCMPLEKMSAEVHDDALSMWSMTFVIYEPDQVLEYLGPAAYAYYVNLCRETDGCHNP